MKIIEQLQTRVENAVSNFPFGYFDDDNDEWIEIDPDDKDKVAKAAQDLKISEEAIIAIGQSFGFAFSSLVEELIADLKDIWKEVS